MERVKSGCGGASTSFYSSTFLCASLLTIFASFPYPLRTCMTMGKRQKWVLRVNNQFLLSYIHLGPSLTIFAFLQFLSLSSNHIYVYGKEAKVGVEGQQPSLIFSIPLASFLTIFASSHSSRQIYVYGNEAKVGVEGKQPVLIFPFLWVPL